jgi:hypothetical protein
LDWWDAADAAAAQAHAAAALACCRPPSLDWWDAADAEAAQATLLLEQNGVAYTQISNVPPAAGSSKTLCALRWLALFLLCPTHKPFCSVADNGKEGKLGVNDTRGNFYPIAGKPGDDHFARFHSTSSHL